MKSFKLVFLLSMALVVQINAQNVGIGTDNPTGSLHVFQPNTISESTFTGSGLDDLVIVFDEMVNQPSNVSYKITLQNAGPVPNLIDVFVDGNQLFSELPIANEGIAIGPGLEIGFEALSGHTFGDAWSIDVSSGNLDQLIVKDDKVGIGIAEPNFNLDVDGDIGFTGDLLQNGIPYKPNLSLNDLEDGINNSTLLALGDLAGSMNNGTQNVFVGNNAGKNSSSGARNVYIGHGAGEFNQAGSGNVFIGNNVGSLLSENNTLKIHNNSSNLPLVYGNFDEKRFYINRNSSISFQEYFGFSADVQAGDYGGMYIDLRTSNQSNNCFPFYGFSINGAPKAWLEYNGSSDEIAFHNFSGNFVVKFQNASKPSGGNWLANSDARLKKNIKSLDSQEMLEKVKQMRGVSYEWDDNVTEYGRPEGRQIGFIAQELQRLWPEKIETDSQGYLMAAYGDYDAVYVEAIKALSEKVDQQEEIISQLMRRIEDLEKK